MAIEIKKVFKKHLPSVRFIGKMYTDKDRVNGSFGKYWCDWHENGWLKELKKLPQIDNIDIDAFGLMGIQYKDGVHQNFQYWIGMMLPENTVVPVGFSYVDIPEGDVGICWIYGSDDTKEIYGENAHNLCMENLFGKLDGWYKRIRNDFKGKDTDWCWFFEGYNDSRMSNKDDKGNVLLDYGIYIKSD